MSRPSLSAAAEELGLLIQARIEEIEAELRSLASHISALYTQTGPYDPSVPTLETRVGNLELMVTPVAPGDTAVDPGDTNPPKLTELGAALEQILMRPELHEALAKAVINQKKSQEDQ